MAIASWYAGTPGSVDIIWTDILVQREINADKTVSSVRLTIETDAADNDFYFDDIAVNYGVAINPKDITYVTRDDHTDVLPASVQHILLTSTYLHKGLAKTTSDDPLDATPGNRPAGELGEIVRYSGDGSLYYCTDETTPVWAVVGGGGGTVTSVTGTTPINSSGGTDPDISIDSASTSQPGVVQLSNSYAGTSEVLAVTELALSQGLASISTPDEKVKYDAGDSSAGYVADKFVAGDGISVAEGTGADENKLKITNTDKGSDVDLSGLCPLTHKTTEDAINGLVKVDGAGNYSGITDNSANWNSAYGWGDHASAGYFVIADNDAGDIQITDTGGFFSSTNVEGALQELGDGMTGNALEIGKTPDESPDGSETVFTVPDGEYQQNTLSVYLNGQRLTAGGTDYSETSPGDGTFTLTTAPQTGDIIQCDYQLSPEVAFDSVIPSGAMIPFSSIATRAGWTYKHEIITPSFTLPMTSLPATRKLGAVGKIGEYLYFGMGTAGGSIVSTIAKYDIAAGTWSTVTPGGDAVTARTTCGGGVYNNKLYICGGDTNGSWTASAKLDEYDPATGNYDNKTDMTTARAGLGCVVAGNYMYAIGGATASTTYSKKCERYDFAGNSWSGMTDMANARRYPMVVWDGGDYIYCIGGYNSSNRAYNERYSISGNNWTTLTAMPTARRILFGWYDEDTDLIYCLCGYESVSSGRIEIYDVANDVWYYNKYYDYNVSGSGCIWDSTNRWAYILGGNLAAGDTTLCKKYMVPATQYLYERA